MFTLLPAGSQAQIVYSSLVDDRDEWHQYRVALSENLVGFVEIFLFLVTAEAKFWVLGPETYRSYPSYNGKKVSGIMVELFAHLKHKLNNNFQINKQANEYVYGIKTNQFTNYNPDPMIFH